MRQEWPKLKQSVVATLCATFIFSGAVAQTVPGPSVTRIIPDTSADLETGTFVNSQAGTWTISGGRFTGTIDNPVENLFHSFSAFDLKVGDAAIWREGPSSTISASSVHNVINRITGGDASQIYGSLKSTNYSNANFYFINPAGVVFGNGAQINVPRALYVSTSNALNFSDGTRMMASTGNGSTLSTSSPQSFGFLGAAGDIIFNTGEANSIVNTGHGATAQFSAQNLTATHASISFGDANVVLVGVGNGAKTVRLTDSAISNPTGFVSISQSRLTSVGCLCVVAEGQSPGAITLVGGNLGVLNSQIMRQSGALADGGGITISGQNVQIDSSVVSSGTTFDTKGGDIFIEGGAVRLNTAQISTFTNGAGAGGDIRVESTSGAIIDNRSSIIATASDFNDANLAAEVTGATGSIVLSSATSVTLRGTTIGTQAEDFSRRTGAINIGAKGQLSIEAASDQPDSGASIFALSRSVGAFEAGALFEAGIHLTGAEVHVVGQGQRTDRISRPADRVNITSTTTTDHPAGDIVVAAAHDLAIEKADILATTVGTVLSQGAGGALRVNAKNVKFSNTLLESSSLSGGAAGGAVVNAENDLIFTDHTVLSSAASGRSSAGDIRLAFGHEGVVEKGSRIDSDVSGGGSRAGNIFISGGQRLTITSASLAAADDQTTTISTSTGNTADGGNIQIDVRSMSVKSGANVLSISNANSEGTGGTLVINADELVVQDQGSLISASSLSARPAGSITVQSGFLSVRDGGRISTDATSGAAGQINIHMPSAGVLRLSGKPYLGAITTSSGSNSGGQITIRRPVSIVSDGGEILALGQINSAKIDISSDYFIRSSDRTNRLDVNGTLLFDSRLNDVSQGTEDIKSEFVDAIGVLTSRCASTRLSGMASRLKVIAPGPFPVETSLPLEQGATASSCSPK